MHVGMATIFREIRRRVGNETFVGVDHPLAAHRLDSRAIFVVFAVRDTLIRVISARDMNRREKREYESR